MAVIHYFAYVSNMLIERLRARCPSAKARAAARADNRALAFCKKGRDGSGKATFWPDAGGRAFGVVFHLDESELPKLDQAEGTGKGYDRVDDFRVHMADSREPLTVVTFIADPAFTDQDLKPYDWYLRLVVAGARQHGLPSQYVDEIEAVRSTPDPKPNRNSRLEALQLLAEALHDAP